MTLEMVMDEKYDEGLQAGQMKAIFDLVRDHLLSPSDGAKRLGMTESEFNREMAKV